MTLHVNITTPIYIFKKKARKSLYFFVSHDILKHARSKFKIMTSHTRSCVKKPPKLLIQVTWTVEVILL